MADLPLIQVTVEGGCVTSVRSNIHAKVEIIDYDILNDLDPSTPDDFVQRHEVEANDPPIITREMLEKEFEKEMAQRPGNDDDDVSS